MPGRQYWHDKPTQMEARLLATLSSGWLLLVSAAVMPEAAT